MKKKLLKNIFSLIVFIITLLAVFSLIKLDILPTRYFSYFIVFEIVIYIIGLFLYNRKSKILFVIGIIFYIICMIANIGIFYYFGKTNTYLNINFNIETYEVKTAYYLLTSSNNEISSLDQLSKDTTIKYYKYSRAVNLAIKKLKNYKLESTDISYDSLINTARENSYFLISKADYLFIIDASKDVAESDFKVIKEFEVTEKIPVNDSTPDSYNIYINGLDYSGGRRDFNLIATVNNKTHKVVLTSIPRDFYIDIPRYGIKDSLTALGTVDPEISKEALEQLFNTKIDYTLNLYTESLVKVVDTIGGVEFCSKSSFYTTHDLTIGSYEDEGRKIYVPRGCKKYNGLETLAIARERMHIANGDRARQDNCRQILINIFKSLASTTTLTNYSEILDSFDGFYTANINKKTITNLIKSVIDNPNYEIIEQSVDGVDGKGTGRLGSMEVWTLTPKMETIESASTIINEILNEK